MSSQTNQAVVPSAVLNESQWTQINTAIAPLNRDQLTWMSGYLAGLANQQANIPVAASPVEAVSANKKLTILYGSQTGNAKSIAQEYKAKAENVGISVNLQSMADYKAKQLKSETHVVVIVSTHGEGDAPDDAVELHEFVASKKAPKLPELKYAVIGLGDSSYEFFCQTAKDFDQRLEALGAKRVIERVDCDVDYDTAAEAFIEQLTTMLKDELTAKSQSQVVQLPSLNAVSSSVSEFTKKNPFAATLSESLKITGRDSVKDIRHIEISLEDSGIQYQPGDAVGIWFSNDQALASEVLSLVEVDGSELVKVGEDSITILQALIEKFELTLSYPTFVKSYLESNPNQTLQALFDDKAKLRDYLADRQIVDVVRQFPAKMTAEQLAIALRPIAPRLYSIASSQAEVEDEVHLTVALVEYDVDGNARIGGASGFLADRLEEGQQVKVYIEENNNFRLPENSDTPVIMVGPGTGIAPFRSFMQQRAEDDAQGKNWLFFGNPSFTQDFLYQTEWQRFVKDGVVDKVSLAFSRDQKEKIYVQHRLLENGEEVYQWLEQGAHFYVCGDATHMAKDVHDALVSIVAKYGKKSAEQAEQYLVELRKAKRYQKDVY